MCCGFFATFFDLICRRGLMWREGMRPRNSALLRWLCNGNGNVCVSFLIFSRCLFCKTGTSAGGAPSPSLSPHPLLFYLSAGKCHLTLFFLPHDFSGFVFPFICIIKLCWLSLFHLPPTPIFLLSFYLLAIASVWWSQVCLLSPSISLSLSSCCKHRLTIQLFFIFLFCLLQSSTAAATATAAHPSGWGSVATTTLKKINLHAASSARPR